MAQVGDWLVQDGDSGRAAQIIGLPHADGSPPYVIRWQSTGHIALVFPGPFTRIAPGTIDAAPAGQLRQAEHLVLLRRARDSAAGAGSRPADVHLR
jgi:Domain of unknown function (DUF1918)